MSGWAGSATPQGALGGLAHAGAAVAIIEFRFEDGNGYTVLQ
jgi:hypothetical protein